ncbi:MAG TPA: hypothetical protein IAD08_04895 [Candidatus Scatovivens faecipullorum]|nr:hypothetical protein [Candidatus Scatovivens faecipullorum]
MLPKIWKKFLLAVCIIACIYNIMSKLVNRNSLEINLKSVDDGTTVFNLFQKEETVSDENTLVNNQVSNSIENGAEEAIQTDEKVEETVAQKDSETNEETSTENDEKKDNQGTKFIVLY